MISKKVRNLLNKLSNDICQGCYGTGMFHWPRQGYTTYLQEYSFCSWCKGTGKKEPGRAFEDQIKSIAPSFNRSKNSKKCGCKHEHLIDSQMID